MTKGEKGPKCTKYALPSLFCSVKYVNPVVYGMPHNARVIRIQVVQRLTDSGDLTVVSNRVFKET